MNLLRIDSVNKTFIPDDFSFIFLSLSSRTFRIPDERMNLLCVDIWFGWMTFIRYWKFSTQTTLYRQCRHSDGWIEVFILKPPCIDRWTLYRQCRHLDGWIEVFILKPPCIDIWMDGWMDSFHPVLKIFYSNHLVSTVSTNITFNALYALIFVSTVLTNIAFNALYAFIFVLTVSTNKIPYTIHNNIALIFCIDFLDMPFNVHTTDKVTMGDNGCEWVASSLSNPHYLMDGWIPFIRYWRFSTQTTLYRQCQQT